MRGKHEAYNLFEQGLRITPAGAGKTARDCGRAADTEDHPRRCGENRTNPHQRRLLEGSPPQVRGKPSYDGEEHEVTGITPAGAGKTGCFGLEIAVSEDHPRRCGENVFQLIEAELWEGSPPQVRGKLWED